MAVYPNNYRTGVGFNPNYTYFGNTQLYLYNAELGTGAGSRLNWQIGTDGGGFARTASCPDGYGMETPFPPVKAGSMSAWNNEFATLTLTGNVLAGGPMEGTGVVAEMDGTAGLSMIVSMSGTGAVVTLTGNSMVLRLTVGLDGSGSWSLTGTPNLALIVPFEGAGSVCSVTGLADLKGRLSLAGEWTPFSELSPESLAAAVWESMLTNYPTSGSAGNTLALAGSGGVDYNALANAVLAKIAASVPPIPVNIKQVNDTPVDGSGTALDPWGPV